MFYFLFGYECMISLNFTIINKYFFLYEINVFFNIWLKDNSKISYLISSSFFFHSAIYLFIQMIQLIDFFKITNFLPPFIPFQFHSIHLQNVDVHAISFTCIYNLFKEKKETLSKYGNYWCKILNLFKNN